MDQKKVSERVMREKEELLSSPGYVDIERLKIELEVYGVSEAKSPAMRKAEVFSRLCQEKTIFIDNNPIVGNLNKTKYGGYFKPYLNFRWARDIKDFYLQRGMAEVSEEDLAWIEKAADYWDGKSTNDKLQQIVLENKGVDIDDLIRCGVGLSFGDGVGMVGYPDYAMVLNKGLERIIADIESYKKEVDIGTNEGLKKLDYYEATSLVLRGMITLARRYASLAREMARMENDPGRRQELERIAETCERVPAYPARNFYEAIQAVWFTIYGGHMEFITLVGFPSLRFTQYMYPFYKKDKEEGKLSDEEVIEMLHFYFLKINTCGNITSPAGFIWSSSRIANQLCIGGLTPDGEDATNELDFLILEAQRRIMLPEPLIALMYHDKLSNEFLMKCVELLRTGIGQPAFHNARLAVDRFLYYDKAPLEEARNVAVAGCVQTVIPGFTDSYWEARVNLAKMVELALFNGKNPLTGVQVGPQTGEAEKFSTYEEFYGAVLKQLQYFIPLMRDISRAGWNLGREFPNLWASSLTHDCLEKGLDMSDGGARYGWGDGQCYVGGVDAANSLAAIKSLVYNGKGITMSQLKEALTADFEGYEEIHRMCKEAPKYGNDDVFVDSIAKDMFEFCFQEHQKKPDFLGRWSVQPGAYSVTAHWAFGSLTGALPNGRNARVALTDGSVSAQPGTDTKGPTALVRSAAKIIDTMKYGNNHFNMKFHPSALEGITGANKLLLLIKTYLDLGGFHVQFNCVTSETLKDAQLHPEKYRDLIVRVAGFSAYFATLDKGVQDEIIARTELSI
ncbi:MAG: pyruvate formate lyase family protein [Pseudomonadota bacterium]